MGEQTTEELAAHIAFTKWGAELTAALSQTLNGVWLRGSRAVPVCTRAAGVTPATADGTPKISSSAGRLTGWSFNLPATAAGEAYIDLHDGTDSTGSLVGSVSLVLGQSDAFQHHGIGFVYGLYAHITGPGADSVRGAVYLGATE